MTALWVNGTYLSADTPTLSNRDSGLTNGLGVFDVMLCRDGTPDHLPYHQERLARDAEIVLGIDIDTAFLETALPDLLDRNGLSSGIARIRTTITGGLAEKPLGIGQPTIIIEATPCTLSDPKKPVRCAIIRDFPRIAGCVLETCKRLDYTRSFAARRAALALGADEAILTNTSGMMTCAATSTLFIEENGILVTPPLEDGVLAGVTRRVLIEQGRAKEESIFEDRLRSAKKIWTANSGTGLRPVSLL